MVLTEDEQGSWAALDLGVGRRLVCTRYALQHGGHHAGRRLRSWVLEATNAPPAVGGTSSSSSSSWTVLTRHDGDELSFPGQLPYEAAAWHVPPVGSFRRFRVRLTGPNSSGFHRLALGGIELYGVAQFRLRPPPGPRRDGGRDPARTREVRVGPA